MNVSLFRWPILTKAYSYIRFSSVKQELGDSVRRQEKLAVEYAREHNLDLDTRTYRDLGISAFKGKNAAEGRLKTFLDAIDTGHVEAGSFLLVESLDRISRNDVDEALELLMSIVRRGISVVTLFDKRVYSKSTIRNDQGVSLIVSILQMSRANEESAIKSSRIRAAWQAKYSSGLILTAMCPAWLTPSEDRKNWTLIPEKVQTIKKIFEMSISGLGSPAIARVLNQASTLTMHRAAHWSSGIVSAILKNQAVIGRYIPKKSLNDPIENYFPKIISESDFRLTQNGMAARQWIGGRNSESITNLFAGYSVCEYCETKMRIVGSNGRHKYLQCQSSYAKSGCVNGRFPYLAAERGILYRMSEDLSEMMATEAPEVNVLPALQLQKNDLSSRIGKIESAIEEADDVKSLVSRLNTLQAELSIIERKISTTLEPTDLVINKSLRNELMSFFDGDGDISVEKRREVQVFLRRIISKIVFWRGNDPKRPTVMIEFNAEHLEFDDLYIDLKPFMETVGGNRRKHTPKAVN